LKERDLARGSPSRSENALEFAAKVEKEGFDSVDYNKNSLDQSAYTTTLIEVFQLDIKIH